MVVGTLPMKGAMPMLKLYVVARVYLLLRKGFVIDAIRLVRKHYDYTHHLHSLRNAKQFVFDVRDGKWPYKYYQY